jgi:radical SAM enzyme (TIGR04100 family)
MMTVTYAAGSAIYVNMTNRCPCACTFCLRQGRDRVFESDSLWLEREPTALEVCQSLDAWDLDAFREVVFCGFGEPTERLDDLLEVAKHIRSTSHIRIRLNTNGLADLIAGEPTAQRLKGLVDTVSVSLNHARAEDYLRVVRPKFGAQSFDAMLRFTRDCTESVPEVIMTVVDGVTSKEEQASCRAIAESLGATLRVRPYV